MAINYASYIPRQVIDTGTPLDQAPDFSRLMDRLDWSNRDDPYGFSRYQYLTPSDWRYWASQKQEGGDPQDTANVQRGQAATALANSYNIAAGKQPTAQPEAPKSELDQERERLRNKFQGALHDDSNAWVQSANRGRAAIDSGNALKPTPQAGSYEFATSTLPSGSENNYIRYDTVGEDLNDKGKEDLRAHGWTEDQINNFNNQKYNWGFMQYLENIGGLRHTQQEYEDYLAEQERQRRAYQAALAQSQSYGGGQGGYSAPSEDSSGGFDMSGNSVADYYAMDSKDYSSLPSDFDSNPARQGVPVNQYDPFDGGKGLRYRGPDNRPGWAKKPLFS